MKKTRKLVPIFLFVLLALIVGSCAPGNEKFDLAPAGFWMGLWHGFISFFTFVISLFSDSVSIYEINNNGNWYNFGFILGVAVFFGGGSKSSCR
jgi:fucose 4-O-acetylase-like acetyltransferase